MRQHSSVVISAMVAGFMAGACTDGKTATITDSGTNGSAGSVGSGGTSSASAATGAATGGSAGGGQGGSSTSGGTGGSSSISTVCPAFDACGGSIVGTWKLPGTPLCGNFASGTTPTSSCPGYSATTAMDSTGSMTYRSDGTVESTLVIQGTEDFTYPRSCIGGMTCDELASKMIVSADRASGSCTENASQTCVCSFRDISITKTSQGNYTTSGGQLIAVGDASATSAQTYCVRSDVLTIHVEESGTGSSATIEYQRQ